ncbi:MAG: electron transport complex subunit RsxB [Gammaproteobacteria bacterium]|nr:MAG: electron transport complex subunit RsxB [Gammaproteobacteria bacterium]
MILGIIIFLLIIGIFGLLLAWSADYFKVEGNPIADEINAILPQTQCGQCNYPGCRPYAEAIAAGEAPINQCPPGGQAGVKALAELLNVEEIPLSQAHGEEKAEPEVAVIIEKDCIGCTLCIQACPVDAILGAAKHMHTVITDECTGCELCLSPCPVDCIVMQKRPKKITEWIMPVPDQLPVRQKITKNNKGGGTG